MAAQGGHGLIHRLADHPAVSADLPGVLSLPCRMLWQCEIKADAADRVERRARLEAIAERRHQDAVRRRFGGR